MFGFLGAGSTALKARHDPHELRTAPSRVGRVELPEKQSERCTRTPARWVDETPPPDLTRQYQAVRKPSDITLENIEQLNLEFTEDHELDELIRNLPRGNDFVPPSDWLRLEPEDPNQPRQSFAAAAASANQGNEPRRQLATGRPVPTKEDFATRLREVSRENMEAFGVLTRMPHGTNPKIRLAFFRRFWESLDNMAYYWDHSLDEYLDPEAEAEAEAEASSRTTGPQSQLQPHSNQTGAASTAKSSGPHSISPDDAQAARESSPRKKQKSRPPSPTEVPESVESTDPSKRAQERKKTYRGMRIAGPCDMPPPYISDTTRGFLEACTWPFGFSVAPPRRPPLLALGTLRLPIRLNGAVWQPPNDRMRARQGWQIGPVLGWTSRVFDAGVHQTPAYPTDTPSEGTHSQEASPEGESFQHASLLDSLREIGALLTLAQERAREDAKENLPGEGKWWTTKPRWGGGKGGEAGEGMGVSDEVKIDADAGVDDGSKGPSQPPLPGKLGSRKVTKKKISAIDAWNTIRPGNGYWDPRVEYRRLGVPKEGDWDDVFLISTLHTHVSILHLRVHRRYVEYLTTGEAPPPSTSAPSPSERHWSIPRLRRTRWYNLFSKEDRIDVFRGLWALCGVMSRHPEEDDTAGKDVVMGEGE